MAAPVPAGPARIGARTGQVRLRAAVRPLLLAALLGTLLGGLAAGLPARLPAATPTPTVGAGTVGAGTAGAGDDRLAALSADERNTIAVFQRAAPSVVFVVNHQLVHRPYSTQHHEVPVGTGSGFLVDRDGSILTNAHVVEDASSLTVILADRRELEARLVGIDPDKDVALIQVQPPAGGLEPLPLGDSGRLLVGQKVLAIGNPYGLDHTLTVGVISALNRETEAPTGRSIRGMVQTDAPINPGNSGGPLLNSRGEVIGMNSAILSETGSNVGIGFAVPVSLLRKLIPQLRRYGHAVHPVLGVELADDDFADALGVTGAIVAQVQPASAAARAGLHGLTRGVDGSVSLGDVIVGVEDVTVETGDDLLHALEQHDAGETVTVHTRYRGETRAYRIVLSAGAP